jgi:hypothetical protein
MRNLPGNGPGPFQATPDLLSQAANVLLREVARLPSALGANPGVSSFTPTQAEPTRALSELAGHACPVTGAATPTTGNQDKDRIRLQAHELVAGLFGLSNAQSSVPVGGPGAGAWQGSPLQSVAGLSCPLTGAELPVGGFDKDQLRRQAHALIETLLITFNDATGEKGLPSEDQVPLIHCAAPVQPGGTGRASLRVTNAEAAACDVTLYSSNFVSDSGSEIPALRVSVTPRRASIPAKGEATFEIALQVSQQTPAGTYSGLIQAMGNRYVKAVLSVDVL